MNDRRNWSESDYQNAYKEFRSGSLSQRKVAQKYGTSVAYIRRFVNFYEKYGRFTCKHTGKLTSTFKSEVIRYKLENHLSLSQTALHFGLNESTVKYWLDLHHQYGERAFISHRKSGCMSKPTGNNKKKQELKGEAGLRQRVEQLEIENAYLKKLYALIQKKHAPATDTGQKPSEN